MSVVGEKRCVRNEICLGGNWVLGNLNGGGITGASSGCNGASKVTRTRKFVPVASFCGISFAVFQRYAN